MKRKRVLPGNVVVLAEYRERRMREAMAEIDRALDEAMCDVLGCGCEDPVPGGHIIPAGVMDEVLPLASERLHLIGTPRGPSPFGSFMDEYRRAGNTPDGPEAA